MVICESRGFRSFCRFYFSDSFGPEGVAKVGEKYYDYKFFNIGFKFDELSSDELPQRGRLVLGKNKKWKILYSN